MDGWMKEKKCFEVSYVCELLIFQLEDSIHEYSFCNDATMRYRKISHCDRISSLTIMITYGKLLQKRIHENFFIELYTFDTTQHDVMERKKKEFFHSRLHKSHIKT